MKYWHVDIKLWYCYFCYEYVPLDDNYFEIMNLVRFIKYTIIV